MKNTYIDLRVDDINKAAKNNDEIKDIPRVSKVILQTSTESEEKKHIRHQTFLRPKATVV